MFILKNTTRQTTTLIEVHPGNTESEDEKKFSHTTTVNRLLNLINDVFHEW